MYLFFFNIFTFLYQIYIHIKLINQICIRKDKSGCNGDQFIIYYKESTLKSKIKLAKLTKQTDPKDLKHIPDFVHKYDQSTGNRVNILNIIFLIFK